MPATPVGGTPATTSTRTRCCRGDSGGVGGRHVSLFGVSSLVVVACVVVCRVVDVVDDALGSPGVTSSGERGWRR